MGGLITFLDEECILANISVKKKTKNAVKNYSSKKKKTEQIQLEEIYKIHVHLLGFCIRFHGHTSW